ncbi:acyltransferase family protein, partial [Enterococcus faecalis]
FFTIDAHILWCFWYQKMIFTYAETSLWYLIDRLGLSYLIYGILGVIAAKYQGAIFTFLKKTRVSLFVLFLFIFLQAVQGNLFDGTQMTPN